MIARRWLVLVAVVAGLLAGGVYEAAMQREDVVVAARDIDAPRPLTADDLEVRSVSAGLAPQDAAHRLEDLVGLVPRAPLTKGQLILTRSVSDELADFSSGLAIPRGFRAVAIPISAVNAVGGAIVPGARVDVLAVPVLGRAPSGRTAELLLASAVVLDVRGESGSAFTTREARPVGVSDRVASVVIAIAAGDEVRFADRIATSTFVLALASAR
ncbi:MAG TPA: Flp pilus assembly protein CpaB [Candidatus Limnocylindria bacterium]|nr:Flp pilus assembly protein CpaB [Candidatus Limnocylindria bacterium]